MRNEEQLRAIAELNDREVALMRKFISMPEDAIGMDGVCKHSCYTNGNDTCVELGITEAAGFSAQEVHNAKDRFTLATAKFFELV